MRLNASHILPVLLLLGGCGGLGLGNVSDEPQLPKAPRRAAAADDGPVWQHYEEPAAPGAAYAPPAAQPVAQTPAPAQEVPAAETYRTADGRVRPLPRRGPGKHDRPAADPAPLAPPLDDKAVVRAPGSAPLQASSQQVPGEERYDNVGYAGVRSVAASGTAAQAIVAVHGSLPAGTIVEVTSLDTSRTILVLVTATMDVPADHVIDLSTAAAQALGGTGEPIPVRVRTVFATPQDQALLRSGQAASERIDAPPALVSALRRRLGAPPLAAQPQPVAAQPQRPKPVVAPSPRKPAAGASYAPPPRPAPRAPAPVAASGGYYVQVAALSAAGRAQALARSLGGSVRAGGGLYRVQLGPYASEAAAGRAKASAKARGYGDAVIVRLP